MGGLLWQGGQPPPQAQCDFFWTMGPKNGGAEIRAERSEAAPAICGRAVR